MFNRGADYVILKPYLGAEHIHNINKELYQLEENIGLDITGEIKKNIEPKFKSDNDYARVLQNLNKLRLSEIKQKIKKKHIILKPKK